MMCLSACHKGGVGSNGVVFCLSLAHPITLSKDEWGSDEVPFLADTHEL